MTTQERYAESELVAAHEMGQFLYCQRKWFLDRSGAKASAASVARMDSGTAYHEVQAAVVQAPIDPRLVRRAFRLLIVAALGLLLLWLWR